VRLAGAPEGLDHHPLEARRLGHHGEQETQDSLLEAARFGEHLDGGAALAPPPQSIEKLLQRKIRGDPLPAVIVDRAHLELRVERCGQVAVEVTPALIGGLRIDGLLDNLLW
jgi:hypothetical protein